MVQQHVASQGPCLPDFKDAVLSTDSADQDPGTVRHLRDEMQSKTPAKDAKTQYSADILPYELADLSSVEYFSVDSK